MTNQELYTKVRNHLLTQDAKALIDGKCVYRTREGLKCAVGCLIPDKHYNSGFEGKSVNNYMVNQAAGVTAAQIRLAMSLQSIHDQYDVADWFNELERVAFRYNLVVEL